MIDEMMTLLESEQVGEDNKKAYYVKSFVERETMRPRHRPVRSLDTRICCPAETLTFRSCGNQSLNSMRA